MNSDKVQSQTVQISEVINVITSHCVAHRFPELKALCFNLFDPPNDTKQAENVISEGLTGYIKNVYDIVKTTLFELKNNKPEHLQPIFRNLVKFASINNDTTFITYLFNLQKELNIENITVLEAVCMTENIGFIRDVVTSLYNLGLRDITIGVQSACVAKLDSVVVFLFKIVDELKMSINYEACIQTAVNHNVYGILNLFLDRVVGTDDKISSRLIETLKNEGKVLMIDFLLQKCKEKRISFRSESILPQ